MSTLLPAPAPLRFALLRGRTGIATPEGCSLRAPIVEAPLAAAARFVGEPRSLGMLIVAEAQGDPPVLAAVSALTLDPAGESRDPKPLPWVEAGSMPPLARIDGARDVDAGAGGGPGDAGAGGGGSRARAREESLWMAAIEGYGAGSSSRVELWRGGLVEALGEGDRFHAVDLACDQGRCALLTTRMGKVAAAGADVWVGSPWSPASAWRRVEIIPASGSSSAQPLALAQVGAQGSADVIAALVEKGSAVFFQVSDPGGAREIARFPAPFGVLDVIAAAAPVAMTFGTAVDENGCTSPPPEPDPEEEGDEAEGQGEIPPAPPDRGPGAHLRFERVEGGGVDVRVPAPPLRGSLRRLSQGSLAVWIAPLGCGLPRHVVYAVTLDATGAPSAQPIPIADAEHFAVASAGDDVDLWLQREQRVTWVPMRCGAQPR